MNRSFAALLASVAVTPLVGCGGGDSPSAPVAGTPTQAATAVDPIAKTAEQFLDAVVKGDTPRATSLLTPAAQQQFTASQRAFASPELGAPTFEVGEVRQVSATEAAVQCLLTDEGGNAEMCCLLKAVGGKWRVSGVVYDAGPGQEPVILNFEEIGSPEAPPQQTWANQPGATPPATGEPAARTATLPAGATR